MKESSLLKKFELVVHDILPLPTEDFMLPQRSLGYRVLFYYTGDHSPQEYWTNEGSNWSKDVNHFVSSSKLKDAVAQIAAGDSDHQKLGKIYDAVMKLDNTNFTRAVTLQEIKRQAGKANTPTNLGSRSAVISGRSRYCLSR